MGLSTVDGIVRQSGGFLEVESEAGRGTRFRIYLPRFEVPAPALPAPEQPAPPPAKPNAEGRLVLLVDDEAGIRRLAARALTKRGWTVLVADSGESALAMMREEPAYLDQLCAIISDVVMPGMDGPALVRSLRGLRPDLPVMLTSGYAEEAVRGGLAIEDVLVLSKPYALNTMLDEVERIALPLTSLKAQIKSRIST